MVLVMLLMPVLPLLLLLLLRHEMKLGPARKRSPAGCSSVRMFVPLVLLLVLMMKVVLRMQVGASTGDG